MVCVSDTVSDHPLLLPRQNLRLPCTPHLGISSGSSQCPSLRCRRQRLQAHHQFFTPRPHFSYATCHPSWSALHFRMRDERSAHLLDHHPGLAHRHLSRAAAFTLYKKKEPLLLTSRLPPQEPSNLPPDTNSSPKGCAQEPYYNFSLENIPKQQTISIQIESIFLHRTLT